MILRQAILSFFASVAFGSFFYLPKSSIMPVGTIGMIGWLLYYIIENILMQSKFLAIFIASFSVSVLGEISAKKYKKPATLFIIPGLLPLVPGAGVYYTMLNFVNKMNPAEKGLETLLVAGAIALGIIVSSIFSNTIRRKMY